MTTGRHEFGAGPIGEVTGDKRLKLIKQKLLLPFEPESAAPPLAQVPPAGLRRLLGYVK